MSGAADIEKRSVAGEIETRATGKKSTVAGYAAVFGESANIGDSFYETIAPGAFTNTLKATDVRAYYGHDSRRLLGRTSAGTLRLKQDSKGLAVEIDLPDTTDGRDVRELIDRGDISGMSFGFQVLKETWDETGNMSHRTIHEVELIEVSVVANPAYQGTSVALRSLEKSRSDGAASFDAVSYRLKLQADVKLRLAGIG